MQNFNLLSPEELQRVKYIKIFYLIKIAALNIFSTLLIISIVFIFSYLMLENNNNSLQNQIKSESTILEGGIIKSTEDAIKTLNNQLNKSTKIQANYIKWTTPLQSFSSIVPDGIIINSLQFNTTQKTILITGVASLRSDLLLFESNLEQYDLVKDISSPLSNLTKKEDINFSISGKLTDDIYAQN